MIGRENAAPLPIFNEAQHGEAALATISFVVA
jgi:hypothetical protein